MKRIVFSFERLADDTHIPRLRDFGEVLFLMFRDGHHVVVDLDEVDGATERFAIVVKHERQLRRTLQVIEPIMAKHFPDHIASISIVKVE